MGEPLQLIASTTNTNGNISYVWTPSEGLSCTDCQNPLVIIYDEEEFTVTITDSLGCFDEASLFIEVSQQLYYFIPNAFTPGNIDGTNDDFRVYGQNIKFVEMIIYNRWGEKVFESASPFVVWDGVFKGELQQPGVYTYYTKITFLNDRIREAKGSVTLLR
jgi:gliding motility-associated-like protein